MNAPRAITLRHRLRIETEDIHALLDQRVSRFDLGVAKGLAEFLGFHVRMFDVLQSLHPEIDAAAALNDLQDHALSDLRGLGHSRALPAPVIVRAIAPLALDYVFAGSRLGGAVLKRRWMSHARKIPGVTVRYFKAPSYAELWQGFQVRAAALPAGGVDANSTVTDARALLHHLATMANGSQLPQKAQAPRTGDLHFVRHETPQEQAE